MEEMTIRPKTRILLIIIAGIALFLLVSNWFSAKDPEIILIAPEGNSEHQGEQVFVSGRVIPISSGVTVNEVKASKNGDGTFTALVKIPMGESVLTVKAVNKSKKSQILSVIKRVPTQEELEAQRKEEEEKQSDEKTKIVELEATVNDLLAAKNAKTNPDKKGVLQIMNNHIKEEGGYFSVSGEIHNIGSIPVSWVMIGASFYSSDNQIVDTRFGFATDFGEVIKPGESKEFATQTTQKAFDRYELEITWEENSDTKTVDKTEEKDKNLPEEKPTVPEASP